MSEYRVVCDTHGTQEWDTMEEAQRCLKRAQQIECVNPRIQRARWTDVEPLPDLPDEMWAWTFEGGNVVTGRTQPHIRDPRWRTFHGTVTDWVEVTDD